MENTDAIDKSLRLRYEAFSTFATEVNRADTLHDVGKAIASSLKFIVDAFAARITFLPDSLTLELSRGLYQLFPNHRDKLSDFETQCLTNNLPVALTSDEIRQNLDFQESIFYHPKITYLFALPVRLSGGQQLILLIAHRNALPFSEIDFRFLRLFCDVLTTKISQLLLAEKIAVKNLALEEANQSLLRLNRQVKKLNASLEKKVDERTHKLAEAHQELNTLFYRTSHDFRRPLTSMLGLVNLLEISQHPEEVVLLRQLLRKSIAELDNMLHKLQSISVYEEGMQAEAIHFPEMLASLAQKFVTLFEEENIHFSYEATLQQTFFSYPILISTLLENLLENAIQYRSMAAPFVRIDIQRKKQKLVVEGSDNGEGIPDHLQDKIFDMYFRASERAQGNGLGLYIVKKLLEKLQGTVSVESRVHAGTTFRLTIPGTFKRISPAEKPGQKNTVLLP